MTDAIKLGKKAFTWAVVAATILWSVGFATLAPLAAHAEECPALSAGDRVTVGSENSVYIITAGGEYMYMPAAETNDQWYGGDFSDVQNISTTCFDSYSLAEPNGIVHLPGAVLVKVTTGNSVYAVLPNNMRAKLADADVAAALYGENWGTLIRDVHNFLWGDYTEGAEITTAVPHDGMLVTVNGDDVYYVMDGEYHMVEGDLGFRSAYVRTVSQDVFDTVAMAGTTVTPGAVTADPTWGDTADEDDTTPMPTGGDLTFSLAGSTPDTVTVPGGALSVPYMAFNVTAGSEDAMLNTVTVHLGGIGSRNDFNKIYIYHNGARVDSGRTLNTDDEATFNVNTEVEAGDTETFWVMADQKTDAAGGTPGDENFFEILNADAVDADGDVMGSFPVRGNTMVVGAQDIGTATVTPGGSDATAEMGEDNVLVGQFDIAASSADDLWLASVLLKNKGTADASILSNIELLRGGTVVAMGEVDGDFVHFELEELFEIEEGDTETFKVYADLGLTDTNDTIQLVLDETSDLEIYSEDFDSFQAGVTNSGLDNSGTGGSDAAITVTLSGGDINVDWTGSNDDIRRDQNNVAFGSFLLTPVAEDLDIDSMVFTLTKGATADVCLEDLRLRDANGNGSYTLEAVTACDTSQTTSTYQVEDLVLTQGVDYEFEVLADVGSTADPDDSYTWSWAASNVTGEGVQSDNTITSDDFSSASLTGPTMTVASSSLTIRSSALTDDTVVNGTDDVLMFRGTLEASSVSDMTLTSMTVQDESSTWDNLINGLKLYIGNDINVETDTPVAHDNTVSSEEAVFNGFSYTIPAGSSNKVKFEIYADINDGSVTGTVDVQVVDIDSTDEDDETKNGYDSDGAVVTTGNPVTTDRDITVAGTGTLLGVIENDFTGLRNDRYALAGTDAYMVGRLELQAQNEDVKLKDLVLNVTTTSGGATTSTVEGTFDSITLYTSSDLSSDSAIATEDMTKGDITFEDVNYVVADGGTQYLYIGVMINTVGTAADGTATPSTSIKVRAEDTGTTAEGVSSRDDLAASAITMTETLSNETTVIPVKVSVESNFAGGTLSGGNQTIFSFDVTADAGVNNTTNTGEALSAYLSQLNLELSTDVGTASSENVSSLQLCRVETSNCIDIETDGTLSDSTTTVSLITSGDSFVDVTNFTDEGDEIVNTGETVQYVVKATVSNVTDKYLQVSLQNLNASGLVWGYKLDGAGAVDYSHANLRADAPRDADYPDVFGGALN